jgi:hypothetical protein
VSPNWAPWRLLMNVVAKLRVLQKAGVSDQLTDLSVMASFSNDRLCGLVVRVRRYRSRDPGSITSATRFPEK